MTEIDALRDLNARLQIKMSLNADDAVAEQRRLQARIDWLEGTAMPHARLQSHADGFQTGWHAALTRVQAGDSVEDLRAVVPQPSTREVA